MRVFIAHSLALAPDWHHSVVDSFHLFITILWLPKITINVDQFDIYLTLNVFNHTVKFASSYA